MDLDESLKNIGMTEKEIRVYLFLLKNGPSTQQELANKTGILRQTIYELVKLMCAKGHLSLSTEGKKKIYTAVNPITLKNKLIEAQENFEQALPFLEKIMKASLIDFSSESFIGMQGLKNLFGLTLNSKTEILWIANQKKHDAVFRDYYWENYGKKRSENKIPIKILIEPELKKYWSTDHGALRQTRMHEFVKNLNSSIVLFDDNVAIYTVDEENLSGVLIKNIFIKKMFERLFNDYWTSSTKNRKIAGDRIPTKLLGKV